MCGHVGSSGGFLAQDEVDDAGDESEGEGDPGEDEGRAVLTRLFFVENVGVNGGSNHNTQTWGLRGGSLSLMQG